MGGKYQPATTIVKSLAPNGSRTGHDALKNAKPDGQDCRRPIVLPRPASTKPTFHPMIKRESLRGAFMTEPSYEELKARLADLEKQVETKKKIGVIDFRVSEKGGVSVYGLGRFPVTLYYEQWTKLLNAVPDLKAFIEENKSKLKLKEG